MTELMLQYLNESSSQFDLVMMKVQAVTEAAERQLAINYNEAELKVMQEAGTDDDLAYLREEADKSFGETIKKTIDKIIAAFTEFFHKIQERIIALVRKKETVDTVDKIEKKIKMFPLLGKKKVTIENTDAQVKVCDEHLSKLAKLKAKVSSGQTVTSEDVSEVHESFVEKHGKAIGVAAAVTVTAAAAFAIMKKRMSTIDKEASQDYQTSKKDLEDMKKLDGAGVGSVASMIAREIAAVSKQKMTDLVNGVANIGPQLKKAFGAAKDAAFDAKMAARYSKAGEAADAAIRGGKKAVLNSKAGKAAGKAIVTGALVHKLNGKPDFSSTDDTSDDGSYLGEESEDQAAASSQQKVEDMVSDEVKEEGPVETAPAATDPIDSLGKVDVWSSVMNDLDGSAEERGDGSCASTGCNENATDTFDTLYKKIFGDAAPNPSDDAAITGGKPNNDKMIADLYKDVMAEVKGKNPEVKPVEPLKEGIAKESTFDALMKEISELV